MLQSYCRVKEQDPFTGNVLSNGAKMGGLPLRPQGAVPYTHVRGFEQLYRLAMTSKRWPG